MAKTRKPKGRSLWWRVHSWAGFKLSIFMTFVLATGTLAVFAHEIDWLVTPAMRATPHTGPRASWGTLAAAAARAVPEGRLQSLHAPINPWFTAEAWVDTGAGSPRRVYVDPWSGKVTGTHGWANVHRFLRQIHRHLMLPTQIGIPIVSALALLFLASLVTGIVTYKKWWRGFFKRPRGGDARRLSGDLHRLGGLWSLWFVALISLTGLWYLVETLGGRAPVPELARTEQARAAPTGAALDRLVARARHLRPDLHIREIRFTPRQGVIVLGQDAAWLVRDRANGVALDPADGAVLTQLAGEELGLHERISEMADPLHFGTFGGLFTKVIWFLFGLILTGMSVTGVIIYAKRLEKAERGARGAVTIAWQGMGAWAWASLALILLALVLTPYAIGGAV
ncbi:PepSY-associated TM helix domain-containing protein [Novosphingobium mangrovi (ex Hu et al. 2023)]|uniref:PepSY domain-containing protein n=1 Tax=Novosphingobium mangrovi (ex Hu et al. 2023) TaxID=2930094 RepID=A0ABT0AGZ5_9SPHN|nr:PepSY-associated TM helix domain-containing protein [Novosphingobium mangrovi (ex Hu et al. 2023)]MCJ1962469.1 PepSY domain-containing protein [Novosphingobium mangrovi (ex Hu et al. 2023)]